MSGEDFLNPRNPPPDPPHLAPEPRPPSFWRYCRRILVSLLLLVALAFAGIVWYASTAHFANVVRNKVIEEIENATGGRVELQSFHWSIRHLAVSADNLTIHGLEAPGELPYAHIDRLYVRIKILAFLKPKIALNYLEADRPVFHLIVYPDGSTNQPQPRHPANPAKPLMDTIFDLEAERALVDDGVFLVNLRAMPFNFAGNNLHAVVTYAPATDRYLADLQVADLTLQRDSTPPLHSKLSIDAQLARTSATLTGFHFSSGGSELNASGTISSYAGFDWKLAAQGNVDVREIAALTGIDGPRQGTADINVQGQGKGSAAYSIGGNVRLSNVSFRTSYLVVDGASAVTQVSVTPQAIELTNLRGRLRDGGSMDASLRLLNWNSGGEPAGGKPAASNAAAGKAAAGKAARGTPAARAPARTPAQTATPSASVMQATIRARVRAIRLPSVLRMVAIRQFQNLGFDTSADGTVNVDWTGDGSDLTVAAQVRLSAPNRPAAGDLPLSGTVDAAYFERGGFVQIRQVQVNTPASAAQVSGKLAVYPITRSSGLEVHLTTTNLAEFDPALTDLGLAARGKTGVAALPIRLQGQAEFTGTVTDSLLDPDVKGHVTATDFVTEFSPDDFRSVASPPAAAKPHLRPVHAAHHPAAQTPPPPPAPEPPVRQMHWDRLDATGEYSSSSISIAHATLTGGGTKIEAQGHIDAHRITPRRSTFDGDSTINASVSIHQAALGDLLALAGQSLPVSGAVNLDVHAGGSLSSLTGGGNVAIQGGDIDGEPYHSITAQLAFAGTRINLVKATLLQDGGEAIADGDYDFSSKTFLANLDATHFELAHIHRLQDLGRPLAGALKFDVHASGTLQAPSILAGVHLTGLSVGGEHLGQLDAVANTQGNTVLFKADSTLVKAKLDVTGQTVLQGDFETQAKIVCTNLDIDTLLKMFNVQGVTGQSSIGATINVAGPARYPKQLHGDAEIGQLTATLNNMTITSQGPVRASLQDGVIHLAEAHITGPDTDMTASGSLRLTGKQDLNFKAKGTINATLAESFDSDITSSGHVAFDVDADGTLRKPLLTGRITLTNVALALNDVPTGISRLNGTLVFDQDRLELQNVVGQTGGGEIKLSGFITYQSGIYGDLTATGKDVRIRYSGISATADATLRLQGSQSNMQLSGTVQITRFLIGPNLDFAIFANGPTSGAPPNPNAASNHVRLDVRITSSPQLDFQNSYAQLAGGMDLRIRGTIAQPTVLGQINITEGSANFAGTTYQLQHGSIYFTNPVHIDPVIDIDASTRIEEYDVIVGLHGSASHLTPTFRSDPPLPQSDVISLLALGRTQQEQQIYSQEANDAGANLTTNMLLGGALNAAVSNRVQRLFGVGSVKIDPTYLGNLGNSTARITVQQNISRTVELTYATNVNTTAEQLIQAQVNLTQNVSVLAIRDESGVFSMVLKVHKRLR